VRELALLVFAAICVYNTGNQWGVQLAHYPLYAAVPPEAFKAYVARQNRLQVVPSIIPGIVQFLAALALPIVKPTGVSATLVILSVAGNIAIVAVTARWSARLHRMLEREGHDKTLIDRLIHRNWYRTLLYTVQSVLVLSMLYQILR
jgi:hypothetical protein